MKVRGLTKYKPFSKNKMDDHKLDSLTKMFNSEYFTDEMLVQYYHKTMNNTGIHDYLTNKLYSLTV